MKDIFENEILCNKCRKKMNKIIINKNGFNLRAVHCNDCNETIIHPRDEQEYGDFIKLKNKEFEVKMRMVGNSYAVSIPREIVDFMKEQEKVMNNMVRLCFEDAGKLSMNFNVPRQASRVIKAREIRVIKNNKPVFHAKQISDSADPRNNKTKVFKSQEIDDR